MRTTLNFIRALAIIGAVFCLTDAFGHTKSAIWFGIESWKILFATLTVWFCLSAINDILKSYLTESS